MNKEILIKYFQSLLPMPVEKASLLVETFQEKHLEKGSFLLKEGKISINTPQKPLWCGILLVFGILSTSSLWLF
jgi:hypothetical protein